MDFFWAKFLEEFAIKILGYQNFEKRKSNGHNPPFILKKNNNPTPPQKKGK
jgi:hypothetical protein